MNTIQRIEEAISYVRNNPAASQYINIQNEDGMEITVRVSDHPANPGRLGPNDLSFVVVKEDSDEEDYQGSSMGVSKKTFDSSYKSEFFLGEKDCITNSYSFSDVSDVLDYYGIQ